MTAGPISPPPGTGPVASGDPDRPLAKVRSAIRAYPWAHPISPVGQEPTSPTGFQRAKPVFKLVERSLARRGNPGGIIERRPALWDLFLPLRGKATSPCLLSGRPSGAKPPFRQPLRAKTAQDPELLSGANTAYLWLPLSGKGGSTILRMGVS